MLPDLVHATRSSFPSYLSQHGASLSRTALRLSTSVACANMNDPGLHEPAQDAAEEVEKKKHKADEQAEEEEDEFLDPR